MSYGSRLRAEAQELVQNGEFDRAVPMLQHVIRLDASDTAAHTLLGICYANTARDVDALEAFRQAAVREPDSAKYHYNYAAQLYSVGKKREALTEADTALRLDARHQGAGALREMLLREMPPAVQLPHHGVYTGGAPMTGQTPAAQIGTACPRCQAPVNPGDTRCWKCGRSLSAPPQPTNDPSSSPYAHQPYQPPPPGYQGHLWQDPGFSAAQQHVGRRFNHYALACAIAGWVGLFICPLVIDVMGIVFGSVGINKGDRDYGIMMVALNSLFLVVKIALVVLIARGITGL